MRHAVGLGQMLSGKERRNCCRANKRRKDVSLLDKSFNISRALHDAIYLDGLFYASPMDIVCVRIAHFTAASVCLSRRICERGSLLEG
jgi:hypothetical protein